MADRARRHQVARPRHDLLRCVLGELGASVEAIEVTDLRDNTLLRADPISEVDGSQADDRLPSSDAIFPGATDEKSPIYVAKRVLGEFRACFSRWKTTRSEPVERLARQMAEILEKMAPDDFKYKDVKVPGSPGI